MCKLFLVPLRSQENLGMFASFSKAEAHGGFNTGLLLGIYSTADKNIGILHIVHCKCISSQFQILYTSKMS